MPKNPYLCAKLALCMNRFLYFLMAFLWLSLSIAGQSQTTQPPTTLEGWSDRLERFGKVIPQEKVFVQLDNTCYFLGDTIWYSAFTRRTDKGLPSNISRVLYVELLNQDGFLRERQLVEMKNGRGHGNFVLNDTLYAGYYELRAYSRWQLNWGITEKKHTSGAEEWFFNKMMAKEYYRDYDKLYSRVFPVYDKPEEPGDYYRDMTTRPLRRYFKSGAGEPQLQLSLFPEGGHIVAGIPCRVAFEAATETGEAVEGTLALPTPTAAQSRGRGVFTFTPETGQEYEFSFTDKNGRTAKAKLPAVETDGVALSVERKGNAWEIHIHAAGEAATKPLGLTIMHEGVVQKFETVANAEWTTVHTDLPPGTNQATVFDADGRIWADRLFFVTQPELLQPSLVIEGLKDEYLPFEQVHLQVTAPSLSSPPFEREGAGVSLSLAIRDAASQDYTYDNGNILTEMLLSSEIKGYVPNPAYFFEADDEEHRLALDLLMMTQGWRRFDWQTMATPDAFILTQPPETQTQILQGEVMHYTASLLQDDVRPFDMCPTPYDYERSMQGTLSGDGGVGIYEAMMDLRKKLRNSDDGPSVIDSYEGVGQGEVIETINAESYAIGEHFPPGSYRMRGTIATARFNAKEKDLKKEVQVHAEFTQAGSESVLGDVETRNGHFTIQVPRFEDCCVFFLSASDSTKWKKGKNHQWIEIDEKKDAEYYVRISWPYPRFTQPYSHYQTTLRPLSEKEQAKTWAGRFNAKTFETDMQDITIRARHGGLRRLDLSKPAYTVDAYIAFNDASDAGLMTGAYRGRFHFINSLARLYVGDMQTSNQYLVEARYDGYNISLNRSNKVIDRFNLLTNISSVAFYTDYNPRTGGDPRAKEDNVMRLAVNLQSMADEGRRVVYRDRRYILQGFNVADDFYHPDYQRTPPAEGAKDYRRTLYWNPDLQLDAEGKADITFFTSSKPSILSVEANGQAADGTLLFK